MPCIILRNETEWVELVEHGWAKLPSNDFHNLAALIQEPHFNFNSQQLLFGDGKTSLEIAEILRKIFHTN